MGEIRDFFEIKKLNPAEGVLKVIHDQKGRAVFLNSLDAFHTVAVLEFLPNGMPRGNHYHHQKKEMLYIMEGKLKAFFWLPSRPALEEVILTEGDLVILEPKLAHAYQALERTIGIEIGACAYDPQDTIPDPRVG